MKSLYLCSFAIILLPIIHGAQLGRKDIVAISSGTSFGFCIGYCRRSINIKPDPYKLIARKEPNFPQDEYPPVVKQNSFSSAEWKNLINLVSPRGFRALNETIGCPDCADGGAEWIEIKWPSVTKRVTFEFGKTIKGFNGLVEALRKLRKKYVDDL